MPRLSSQVLRALQTLAAPVASRSSKPSSGTPQPPEGGWWRHLGCQDWDEAGGDRRCCCCCTSRNTRDGTHAEEFFSCRHQGSQDWETPREPALHTTDSPAATQRDPELSPPLVSSPVSQLAAPGPSPHPLQGEYFHLSQDTLNDKMVRSLRKRSGSFS